MTADDTVTAKPKRIQMSRQHPWRKDHPDAVIVARPSKWGNPFKGEGGAATHTRQVLVDNYRFWLTADVRDERGDGTLRLPSGAPDYLGVPFQGRPSAESIRTELAGRDLACWCPLSQPCHADVLLELAAGGAS